MIRKMQKNKEAFLKYNERRKKRALEVIPDGKKGVLDCLLFLIHTNCPGLPGFVDDKNVPFGIYGFTWDESNLDFFKKRFHQNLFLNKAFEELYAEISPKKWFVESVLIMGSIGSVAQSHESDFDYWICIDKKKFPKGAAQLLLQKLQAIEKWIDDDFNMEVHFFITDVEKARLDSFGEVDKESAGTSQGKTLKEEFYRTLILQAGKIPLWWITPAGITDKEYGESKKLLISSDEYSDIIDLGNVYKISTAEFFGAALWQLNKAIHSPFKSVLKMALLEIFLDNSGESCDLLSNIMKQRVHSLCNDIKLLDPYTIMLDSIAAHNQKKKRSEAALFLKKCFYIKTGIKLSRSSRFKQNMNTNEKIMMFYAEHWGWSDDLLNELNTFKDWDFSAASRFGKQVHKFLRETYIRLSDMLKKEDEAKQQISDSDRTILGRKLFSIYSKQPNKVEYLERATNQGMWQGGLTFYAVLLKSGDYLWKVYRGQVFRDTIASPSSSEIMLKSSKNIVEILMWLIHNRVCDERTSFYLVPNPTPVVLPNIQKLAADLIDFFPKMKISHLSPKDLLENPRKIRFFLIINFNKDSWVTDMEEITVVYNTTWGELYCKHFANKEGFQKVQNYLLEDSPRGISDFSDYYKMFIVGDKNIIKMVTKFENKLKEQLRKASYRK